MDKILSTIESFIIKHPFFLRFWYDLINIFDKDNNALVLNFGFGGKLISLNKHWEKYRTRLQMYYYLVKSISTRNRDILEVSCGRGGGAYFLTKRFKPKSYIGVDFSSKSIEFCKSFYKQKGLSFTVADAHNLPFKENSFDIVINIESAHLYKDKPRFFKQVFRVLKPKGYFLLADLIPKTAVKQMSTLIKSRGFKLMDSENITKKVVPALDYDNEQKLKMIKQEVPFLLQKAMQVFSGVKGSPKYNSFLKGTNTYWKLICQKP